MAKLQIREKEIFETLRAIQKYDFVIIGGYSVNAYALPRFSIDCDIVVNDKNKLTEIETELTKMGYIKIENKNLKLPHHGKFYRYEKTIDEGLKVAMDILFSEIWDRQTNSKISAEWIMENSSLKLLRGKTITENIKLRIINVDALIVMKLISCRNTDIRDIFMMITKAENLHWIKEEVNKIYSFKERFGKLKSTIISKEFKNNLQGVYGYIDEKTFEKYRRAILELE